MNTMDDFYIIPFVKKLPKLLFITIKEVTIPKNGSDHFYEIDRINKMTLVSFCFTSPFSNNSVFFIVM